MKSSIIRLLFIMFFAPSLPAASQMITGVWKGKINRQKAEVKIIQDGDSLRGTSYYYESPNNFRRYSIRGYFDAQTNEAVWWDDQLLDARPAGPARGKLPMVSRADFNCPGGGKMMLDGRAGRMNEDPTGIVDLDKTDQVIFPDEWDFVIDNYLVGANDPYIIDSIGSLARGPHELPIQEPIQTLPPLTPPNPPAVAQPGPGKEPAPPVVINQPKPPQTIEEKFISRKKILTTEIPVSGDSIELRFYDNAEIDGDSISLFLDDKLIFAHIRLTGSAHTIHIPLSQLGEVTELTMVAENLGSIPPNTSYMVAIVNEKRYEARLESNEGSSAMVRFVKGR